MCQMAAGAAPGREWGIPGGFSGTWRSKSVQASDFSVLPFEGRASPPLPPPPQPNVVVQVFILRSLERCLKMWISSL